MREFTSMASFAGHLLALEVTQAVALHHGLKKVAEAIEKTAKEEIGHYQQAIGPFPQWEQLADSTEDQKARLGYPTEAPLLRDGKLRESISHQVGGLEAVIGSNSDIMVYQEIGTVRIPPRPVLGPAALRNKNKMLKLITEVAVTGLIGTDVIHPSLGYNFET